MSSISDIGYRIGGMGNDVELTFGEWFGDVLEQADLLQEDLAEAIGVGQSTISGWVNDTTRPSRLNCYRIADFFGLPRREVVLRAGHKPKPRDLLSPLEVRRQVVWGDARLTAKSDMSAVAETSPPYTAQPPSDPRQRLFLQKTTEKELTDATS